MTAVRAPWSSAAFLVYLGGLTILGAIAGLLGTQSSEHGPGGFVLAALLIYLAVTASAFAARGRGHLVTAGLLALSSVGAFVVFVGALLDWFGWLPHIGDLGFDGFHFWLLFLELVLVVSSAIALRSFGFPLLVFVVSAASWFFVTDLISNGGDWSAVVTILFGLILLAIARGMDTRGSQIRAFWVHVVAGVTIGGGLLWFFHDGDVDWILVGIAGLIYIALGDRLWRSSWVVLGAWGVLQTTAFYADKWSGIGTDVFFPFFFLFPFGFTFDGESGGSPDNPWAGPLVFIVAGLVFIGIALRLARRRREPIPGADQL
jgi:hypothetical protein